MTKPETPSERVALVVWYMAHGMGLSTREVARLTGLQPRNARELMYRVSRILPVYQEEGVWLICKGISSSTLS